MASIVVAGDTSGTVTLAAPAVSGTTTLTLPTTSGTIVTTSGAQTIEFADGSASAPSITNSGDTNTGMFFPAADTIAFAEGGTEAMRLDANGNVGIGTSTTSGFASGKLIVASSGDNFVSLQAGTTNASGINMVDSVTGSAVGLIRYQHASDAMDFFTNGSQRMIIDSSGNVNIGAASPSSSTPGTSYFAGSNTYWNNFVPSTVARNQFTFNNPNGEVGRVVTTGSSTSYNTSSDYRLKENVVPMTGALDKVLQLKPVSWTWKSDGLDGQGFIAHELAEVIPDAVSGDKDAVDAEGKPIYQGVDTSFLVATLTAAIQEQQTIIETLKADIAELKAKVNQ